MFDSQNDLASLVFTRDQDPDQLLFDFAADLSARGQRVVGLVQIGHHCHDGPNVAAKLVHSHETIPLFQNRGSGAHGCRLDVGQLMLACSRIEQAIDAGADLVIVNRFGKQEMEGKGLIPVIQRAMDADIPLVVAVEDKRFAEWVKFSDGMCVKLNCDRGSLERWWASVGGGSPRFSAEQHQNVCEVAK